MSAGFGKERFGENDVLNRIYGEVESTGEKLKKLFGFQEKEAEEIVEEMYDVRNLNVDSLNSEVEKLRKKLQEETPKTYSCNEAAFLLYSYISRLMVEKKSNYESLSRDSDKKKRQKAAGNLTSISYLLDISSDIRKEYDLEECSLDHKISVVKGKNRSRSQDKEKQAESIAEELAERKLKEIKEKNQMLRRYVEQQSSV